MSEPTRQAPELKLCPFCAKHPQDIGHGWCRCLTEECPAYNNAVRHTQWNTRHAEPNEKRAVTLTVGQCLDAAQSCGGLDDLETEITIEKMDAWKCRETGEDMPAGLYAHLHDYPEEGLFGPLSNVQPESEPANERLRKAAEKAQCDCTPSERDSGHKSECWFPELRAALTAPPQKEGKWCAMCGKWTDHQSGTCPELDPVREAASKSTDRLIENFPAKPLSESEVGK